MHGPQPLVNSSPLFSSSCMFWPTLRFQAYSSGFFFCVSPPPPPASLQCDAQRERCEKNARRKKGKRAVPQGFSQDAKPAVSVASRSPSGNRSLPLAVRRRRTALKTRRGSLATAESLRSLKKLQQLTHSSRDKKIISKVVQSVHSHGASTEPIKRVLLEAKIALKLR